jgi:hypothetical protein
MRFKTDDFSDRVLETKDGDGDRLRVIITNNVGFAATVAVNTEAVIVGRKKLRKLAKRVLKETRK